MLHKTQAIVLKYIKYRETSIIVKIYTELFGLQSYIVNGVRSERGKYKIALFQPLSLLDMVVYHKDKKNTLQRISEVRSSHPYQSMYFDIKKVSVAMFMAEVLSKALREEEQNEALFSFLQESVTFLDKNEQIENFSIQFLLQLSKYLGFFPSDALEIFEHLHETKYIKALPSYFSEEIYLLNLLKNTSYEESIPTQSKQRQALINFLLMFYELHLEGFGQIKSLDVLREVLS